MIDKMNMHYSFTNPSTIHDEEALTSLELAGRTAYKMNELVADQNNLRSQTENKMDAQDKLIELQINEQNANIHNMNTVVMPAKVTEEVQKQINNGTFDDAIDEYAGQLEARLNNLLNSTPEGSTTMDAEVIDARIGYDEKQYANLGEAVRQQIALGIKASNHTVSSDNYNDVLTSADDCENGLIYFIRDNITKDMVTNLPQYGSYGIITTFHHSTMNTHGKYQLYVGLDKMYYRFEHGFEASNWSQWFEVMTKTALNGFVQPSNLQLTNETYADIISDANDAVPGKTYFVSNNITKDMIANLPQYGKYSLLVTMCYHTNGLHGKFQLFITPDNLFHRVEHGNTGSTWEAWQCNTNKNNHMLMGKSSTLKITIDEENHLLKLTGYGYLWTNHHFIDFNTITNKSVSLVPDDGVQYTFVVFIREGVLQKQKLGSYKPAMDDIMIAQLFLHGTGRVVTKIWLGGDNEQRLDALEKEVDNLALTGTPTNHNTCAIFRKVCCVGDSYTSGHISTSQGYYDTNEDFAYPSFMARLTGNEYINCGKSGANVLTWQTDERGLPKAQATGKVQAYLVGLGLNDVSTGTSRYVELGTTSDIGTEAQTYYGGLSKIIRELAAISPEAMIFVQTMPSTNATRMQYNEAIRNIVNEYKNAYNVHLLDLYAYRSLYQNASLTGDAIEGHYTAIGYQQFAEILRIVWSEYINNNISKFQNVHLIDMD